MRWVVFLSLILAAVPSYAVDSEFGYEFWDMSFFTPSRTWRLGMREQIDVTMNSFEYLRTSRFGMVDNTFDVGYAGREAKWSWDFHLGYTPKAGVMYEKMAQLTLFLPQPGLPIEPSVRGDFKRYGGAKLTTTEAGLRWLPAAGWEASGRWGRIQTDLLIPPNTKHSSPFLNYQLGYQWSPAMRLFVFQGSGKEFFDPGNPANPLEYNRDERGGGFHWGIDSGIRLMGTYALEKRSNGDSIRKYVLTLQQTY